MKTYSQKPLEVEREWFVIDAEGLVLGRLASIVAMQGELVLHLGDRQAPADYSDPVVRLVNDWLQKVRWVVAV